MRGGKAYLKDFLAGKHVPLLADFGLDKLVQSLDGDEVDKGVSHLECQLDNLQRDRKACITAVVEVKSEVDKVKLAGDHLFISFSQTCDYTLLLAYLAQYVNEALSGELVLACQLRVGWPGPTELTGTSLTITEVWWSRPDVSLNLSWSWKGSRVAPERILSGNTLFCSGIA